MFFKDINSKDIKLLDCILLLVLSGTIVVSNLLGVFNKEFFYPWALTFEGGYRILKGQIPYRDFLIPTGPVVYYIQAILNYIFGSNLIAVGMHMAVLGIILCAYFYCTLRRDFNRLVSFVLAYCLFISFCGTFYFPVYSWAASFFLLLNLLILINSKIISFNTVLISIIICTLSFFSKQDKGLLQFLFIGFYILLFSRKKIKYFSCFILSVLTIISLIMLVLNSSGDFFHWFNLGQPPHDSMIHALFTTQSLSWTLKTTPVYLILFSIFLWFDKSQQNKKQFVFILFTVNFITLITSITSSSGEKILLEAIPLSLFLILKIFEEDLRSLLKTNKTIVGFICLLSLIYLMPITNSILHLVKVTWDSPTYTRIAGGSYNGCVLPEPRLALLYKIKSILNKHKNFLNISEFNFLYADYNLNPPKPMPLWFHYGISFFDENVPEIENYVKERKPEIILLQEIEPDPPIYKKLLDSFISLGYKVILMTQEVEDSKPIYVLELNQI